MTVKSMSQILNSSFMRPRIEESKQEISNSNIKVELKEIRNFMENCKTEKYKFATNCPTQENIVSKISEKYVVYLDQDAQLTNDNQGKIKILPFEGIISDKCPQRISFQIIKIQEKNYLVQYLRLNNRVMNGSIYTLRSIVTAKICPLFKKEKKEADLMIDASVEIKKVKRLKILLKRMIDTYQKIKIHPEEYRKKGTWNMVLRKKRKNGKNYWIIEQREHPIEYITNRLKRRIKNIEDSIAKFDSVIKLKSGLKSYQDLESKNVEKFKNMSRMIENLKEQLKIKDSKMKSLKNDLEILNNQDGELPIEEEMHIHGIVENGSDSKTTDQEQQVNTPTDNKNNEQIAENNNNAEKPAPLESNIKPVDGEDKDTEVLKNHIGSILGNCTMLEMESIENELNSPSSHSTSPNSWVGGEDGNMDQKASASNKVESKAHFKKLGVDDPSLVGVTVFHGKF